MFAIGIWRCDHTVSRGCVWLLQEREHFDVWTAGKWSKWRKVYLYWKFKSRVPVFKGSPTLGKSIVYQLLSKPKIHHHNHNSAPLDAILSFLHLTSILTTYIQKIVSNIILPSSPWSNTWPLSQKQHKRNFENLHVHLLIRPRKRQNCTRWDSATILKNWSL